MNETVRGAGPLVTGQEVCGKQVYGDDSKLGAALVDRRIGYVTARDHGITNGEMSSSKAWPRSF